MKRSDLLASCALPFTLCLGAAAHAQDLQVPSTPPPPPAETPAASDDQVQFSAGTLEYDIDDETVIATGDVRMYRSGDRLRADKVVWNRKTGKVVATGSIVVVNPGGDTAYGDSIELTDSLKDGVVDNMLIVLERGGRLAARRGTRALDETVTLQDAAYTPCAVTDSSNCPKQPSWKITAVKVIYRPEKNRIYYTGAHINLFGLPSIPLPAFSHPAGGESDSGLLSPDLRYGRVNGLEFAQPYFFALGPNRALTVTPRIFSNVLPMLQADYSALDEKGAFRVGGYATVSRRSDDLLTPTPTATEEAFRGYIEGVARYQLDPNWTLSGSFRLTTDRTFLRRYDISNDDRLRNTVKLERIDADSYFAITGWAVQTLRVNDRQGFQPIALPEIDYRRRFDDGLIGGKFELQLNSLAITRSAGQDTQRAFASARWDLRKLTPWGQEVTFTAYARGDVYNASDTIATTIASYRGDAGIQARAIGALAIDVKWPLIGSFLNGTQRLTPRFQIVASPKTENLSIPNEDARAVDLEDSNLFALNRFPGYDRWEDSTRFTYGVDWAVNLPGFSLDATVGQSYRLDSRPALFPAGTGLDDRVSDIVGRTEVRFRDFVSITHRYRLDKDNLAIRRNEIDATIGSRSTYVLVGYLRLNRNIDPTLEDLQDREELRLAGRVQFAHFWSVFGSTVIDLTNKAEDPTSLADGFDPVRHRLGVQYEDDCLRLGLTWRRSYQDTGDAKAGNSFLLSLSFKNLGR
ncbi:MAG: organic solvent tolerance protein [Sphingomonas bacterium]|uniref:LPS-assembly protein LptD n=1 Tax=Sphingomonas bacterium TaxID=1895847 RepID=UPI00261AE1FF|nr:LPS assembly protein LptD [Sphingomonas bacterium]MDB5706540.1 organic solvent tolerance protein [Sphingomonas bacterium]